MRDPVASQASTPEDVLPATMARRLRRSLRRGRVVVAAALALALSGCAFGGDDTVSFEDEPPADELYAQGVKNLQERNFTVAMEAFDEVERLYPTSTFAKRAMIKSAEASYANGDYDRALLSASRFLDFYPSDEQAAYAQYLIASSLYDQITDVGRDQKVTRDALQAMRELVARYPESEYAREAQLKMDLALDHLAGKEMEVGRFYLRRGELIGAINRFRTVVEQYQTTSHVPEALHRLVEAYLALGVEREAQTAAAVLGHNFPGSPWYTDSFALLTGRDLRPERDEGSWMSRVYNQVVRGEWL